MVNFIKTRWLLLLISAGIALICLLLFFPGTPEVNGAQIFRDTSLEKLGVVTQAGINMSVVEYGKTVDYSIVVYNTGASELQNLCISLNAPGFLIQGQNDKTKCFASVSAATSESVTAKLTAIVRSGQYRITASYEAKRQNSVLHSAISAGPVEVTGLFGQAMWVRFVKRAAQLTKDLTLPFVLAVLAYLFQKLQTKREQRQEVRNIILPFVHALSEKHYMPIVRSAVLLIRDTAKWKSAIQEQKQVRLKLCFYDFVVMLKRMDYLRKDKGQVFFQNRDGEKIASSVWTIAKNQCQAVFGEEGIDSLTMLEPTEIRSSSGTQVQSIDTNCATFIDYSTFIESLKSEKISNACEQFSEWLSKDDFSKFLNLLNVLQAVFTYESNRPFNEHWYEESKGEELEFMEFAGPLPKDFPLAERDFPLDEQYREELKKLNLHLPEYIASTKSN